MRKVKKNLPWEWLGHYEFMHELRVTYIDDLEFDMNRAHRSICKRRSDFNTLYRQYCCDQFGDKNGKEMLDKMEEKLKELNMNDRGPKLDHQLFYR